MEAPGKPSEALEERSLTQVARLKNRFLWELPGAGSEGGWQRMERHIPADSCGRKGQDGGKHAELRDRSWAWLRQC